MQRSSFAVGCGIGNGKQGNSMHFSLVKIAPEGLHSAHGFDDVILPVFFALKRLGYDVEMCNNQFNQNSRNIFFGSCQAPLVMDDPPVPRNSILFNLEQMSAPGSLWNNRKYVEYQLRRFSVWDYSRRNIDYLRDDLNIPDCTFVQLGYVPEMTRLAPDFPKDIDVLFYGAPNPRREEILQQLAAAGVRMGTLHHAYGGDRDHAIARARLVLNVHFYSPATLELPRLGYLWANRKPVVSECGPDTEQFPGLENACAYAAYDEIVPTVRALLAAPAVLDAKGGEGFAAFSGISLERTLEAIVGRRNFASGALPLPTTLQAGSGNNFRYDCLNVDLNPDMTPDIVMDLCAPLDPATEFETARFGRVRLLPESFEKIIAFDVLEQVADLSATMNTFLDLLREGGELEVNVPYDLSLGAWQDPTHVRAFNESSWKYYAEWSWHMGWRDWCFDVTLLDYQLSEFGTDLKNRDVSLEELTRTPRAVESMRAVLRKRRKTPEEREHFDRRTRGFYASAAGEWTVGQGF